MKKSVLFLSFCFVFFWLAACDQVTSTSSMSEGTTLTSTISQITSTSASSSTSLSTTIPSTSTIPSTTSVSTQPTTTSRLTTTVSITTASWLKTPTSCVEETFELDLTNYERVTNVIGNYEWFQTLVEIGDVLCVNVGEQVKDANVFYNRYLLFSSNPSVATVHNNIITVIGSGVTEIGVAFFDSSIPMVTFATLGTLRSVDPSAWIEIRTAEELAAMNENKSGAYVLKANIDLLEYGEWSPIGGPQMNNQFTGVFINPDGFVISHLRISSASSVNQDINFGPYVGLFGGIIESYIEGIILEHVYIDVSDYQGTWLNSVAGGITGSVSKSVIRNCYVSGYIIAQYFAGGIAGGDSWSLFEHNHFWGEVKTQNGTSPNREMGAGGIVGFSTTRFKDGGIVDCHVIGTVIGNAHAGGIVGSYIGERFFGNTFTGIAVGVSSTNDLIGFDRNNFGS